MKEVFSRLFEDITKCATKIPQSSYLIVGKYPIIDQGQSDIAGYFNESTGLFTDTPVIIFGDHTRVLKYVNHPFFIGADGVKVLKSTRKDMDSKYLFYALQSIRIPNTGYNRHFKWLKESSLIVKTLTEQKRIAQRLDKVQELIAQQKEQISKLDLLIKSKFIDMFGDPITNPKNWTIKEITSIAGKIFAGGDRPDDFSIERTEEYRYPIYSNGVFNKGLLGFSKNWCVSQRAITISARGVIGFLAIREPFFTPVVRLITLVPNNEVSIKYLLFLLKYSHFINSGTSQKQLTVPNFKKTKIIMPLLNLQNEFANFVTAVEKQKGLLQTRLTHLETLYKSLMQEYFE